MRPLLLALVVTCLLPLAACSQKPIVQKQPTPRQSVIEGFGIGGTPEEAASSAWDDALTRAERLGYERFDVRLISRSHGQNSANPADLNRHAATVVIEVYPGVVNPPAPPVLPPVYDQPGEDLRGRGR